MAITGQINTNTTYDSYFWVYWKQISQDVATNTTRIYWSCGVNCGHSFYLNAIRMSAFTINGVQVYAGGTYSNFSKGEHGIASGYLDIEHDYVGTKKTLNISSFTGWLYSNYNYYSNGGSFELTQIPRKATITAAYDFTDQQNPVIYFNNPGGFQMDVWLEPNPVGDHLCERNNITNPQSGQYTWDLTAEEREQLRSKCPGNDCTIRLGLYTHIGNTIDADYRDRKFIMTENEDTKPSVSMSIEPDNGSLPDKFKGLYIQGKSKLKVILSAEGKYGAGIQSYAANIEGTSYSGDSITTNVIQSSGDVSVTGYARDTRGFLNYKQETINVIGYSKPLVIPIGSENGIQCYRCDSSGNRNSNSQFVRLKVKRSYNRVNGTNTCKLQWRWKETTDEWPEKENWFDLLLPSAKTDEYDEITDQYFGEEIAYTIQIRAIDDIGEYDIKTLELPTRDVALHLGKGGKNVAVGTYCDYSEDHTFYSEWKAIFDKDVVVGGDILIGKNKTTLKDYILSVINGGG